LSGLNQLSMENGYMHPMKYNAIMKSIEVKANDLMKGVFSGTIDPNTNREFPIPSHAFENNPVYILLGGARQTNYGYKINTAKQFTSYQKNMMKSLFDQGNQLFESKSNLWDSIHKEYKHQGKDCRK
jgi:hypothetical protein